MVQRCRLLILLPLLAAAVIVTARDATAQSVGIDGLRFTTAFPFMTENATLDAGSYTVTRVGANPRLLQFTNDTTRKTTLVTVNRGKLPVHPPYPTGVSFEHTGDAYLLSSIWDATSGIAADAVKPAPGRVSVGQPTFRSVPATKDDSRH
ncbi:MAG TPA: hypothetical protein VHD57_07990 [Vicinamibacterales bacterium]|jgi:hypothetical protein|nr:hypothetical protein [Vicinamibacterales bacterium]